MSDATELPQASPVDNPDAPAPGQTEEQRLAQEVASLKKQLAEEIASHAMTKSALDAAGAMRERLQQMLGEMTGHVISVVKAMGKLVP